MKIAVAGFGFMGVTHTINILKHPDLELVAIVDKFPENIRKNLSAQIGNFSTGSVGEDVISQVAVYTSLADCLAKETPDACVISVHTDLHFELTMMALEAGVHVFLEKPFSLSTDEAGKMAGFAREKGLLLMIGHVVRFMPAYLQLKNWIDSGEFGKLRFLSLSRFSGLPAWGQWKEKRNAGGSSGGALFDLLIHDIDYAQWVLGSPTTVRSSCIPGELSDYDYINALWEYDSGLMVKVEGGNIFHTAFPFQAGFFARFERRSVSWSSQFAENIKVADDTEITLVPVEDANLGFSGELDYFTRCVRLNEKPVLCTPESAISTLELCFRHAGKE